MNGENRFSLLGYAGHFQGEKTTAADMQANREDRAGFGDAFLQWSEEIRRELAAARGRTEEERQNYSSLLNRAVLGYEADRLQILMIIQDLLAKRRIHDQPPPNPRFATLAEAIFAEIIGMNVLELILKHKEGLEEIQVVGRQIYEVRSGLPRLSAVRLATVKELERIQQNLVLFNKDTLSPRKRWAEVMLNDGSRVTMTGFGYTAEPTLTIRFYTVARFDLNTLCLPEYATIEAGAKQLLACILQSGFNIVIIGPTNSGKTHLLKALIAELPAEERIVTIETRYELMLKRDFPDKNIVEYEADDEDARHSSKQAFKLALRQSPKRIVHAEIRDEDANIYVRACTRGHEGSMTTVHVNELEDAPDAITDMCMMDGRGMDPVRLAKRVTKYVTQIGLEMRLVNGKRKLVRIGEFEYTEGEAKVRDWMVYEEAGGQWCYPGRVSERARNRMRKNDPGGYNGLISAGLTET